MSKGTKYDRECPSCGAGLRVIYENDVMLAECESGCSYESIRAAYDARIAKEKAPIRKQETYVDAATLLFDEPPQPRALCGSDDEILHALGEPLLIAGGIGIGKTTLIQQYMIARLGLADNFLGFRVEPAVGKILLLSLDRPEQALNSLLRMIRPEDEDVLRTRLVIRKRSLRVDRIPENLTNALAESHCTEVYIDSLKDLAGGLKEDRVGARVAESIQMAIESGAQVIAAHHIVKRVARPTLDDVFGSVWITAGLGSVFALHGKPGDGNAELIHLKAPTAPVGPLKLQIDYKRGLWSRDGAEPDLGLLRLVLREGEVTAKAAAVSLFGSDDRGNVEKARRLLESDRRIERSGQGTGRGNAARYRVRKVTQKVTVGRLRVDYDALIQEGAEHG